MYTTFYGATFYGGGFFGGAVIGGKNDGAPSSKKRGAVKPTGLLDRPKKARKVAEPVADRVAETAEIHAETLAEAKFAEPAVAAVQQPVTLMSMVDVEREIGRLLRKVERTEDDELLLLMLMAAAAA